MYINKKIKKPSPLCVAINHIIILSRELLKGESQGLLKLPTDKALVEDSKFRFYVELYAKVKLLKQRIGN